MEYEYKVYQPKVIGEFFKRGINTPDLERILNELGGQEWELVSVSPISLQIGFGSQTSSIYFIFKRILCKK
jgi:hypothetical protein